MSILKEAAILSEQRWVNSFPEEFEEVTLSKNYQKKMKILFDKMRGGYYHRLTRRAVAALIAAIIALSVAVTAFAVPTTREFIISHFFDHSVYTVSDAEQTEVEDIVVGYIPEGFEVTETVCDKTESTVIYSKNSDWINISKYFQYSKIDFDTEHNNYKKVEYNNTTYIDLYGSDVTSYIWNDNNYIYLVESTLSEKELFEIVKTIK